MAGPDERRAPRLTREVIIRAAIDFIEEHGLPALSMRRLGERLGVEAMAFYYYVPNKEALLDGVVEVIVDEMRANPDVRESVEDGWQDFVTRLAHGVRAVATTYPQCFPLIASRPAEAPWLRPPLRSLFWVETFLEALQSDGFGDLAAADAYRAFTSFLLGHLLLEASMRGADLGPIDVLEGDQDPAVQRLAQFPRVVDLREQLSLDRSAAEFAESLEHLLERITRMRNEDGLFSP